MTCAVRGENKAVQDKVQELKKQYLEVEVELDGLRAVLKQAENKSKIDQREVNDHFKRPRANSVGLCIAEEHISALQIF